VRATLRSLPKTLDETYDRILVGISETDRAYTFRALQWLAFSARPVSIAEAAEAMIVDLDCALPHVDRDRALRDPHDLLDICASLVRLSSVDNKYNLREPNEVLELAHFSVKEYLVSSRVLDGPAAGFGLQERVAHRSLAECCLAYLLTFDCPMSNSDLSAHPLARYSARYWPFHTHQAGQDCNAINKLGTMLISPGQSFFENSLCLYDDEYAGATVFRGGPLYYMALYGFPSLAGAAIKSNADINARGGKFGSALQAASALGHLEVVRLLLDHGADANAQGGFYCNALLAALVGGQLEVVRLLLSHGADANAQGGYALHAASGKGHLEVAQLLLDHGADVNAQREDGSVLQAASIEGHLEVVRLLLDRGANANMKVRFHGSALYTASAGGHFDVVRLLLDRGADANAQGGKYGSALFAASAGGYHEVMRLLLDRGADVNAQGGYYALRAASAEGHLEVVRLLLDHGADVNAHGEACSSALQTAIEKGHLEVMPRRRRRLLLDHGANPNFQEGFYGNALQAASARGQLEVVQLLLDHGADANAQGGLYGNALRAASVKGHAEVVRLLLGNGANASTLNT
jgi:ankyrin repeat protein